MTNQSASVTPPLQAGSGRAPSMVILGAPRCGTTSLAKWLSDAGLGVGVKDSFFLMDDDAGLRGPTHLTTHGAAGYLSLFPRASQPTVECTAGYVYQRRALAFFQEWSVPPQFVLIVRDPVDRLRSVYRYFAGNLGVLPRGMTFSDYVHALAADTVPAVDQTVSAALQQGNYALALQPWTAAFGRDCVHVIPFDDLRARPADVVARLARLSGGNVSIDLGNYDFSSRNESFVAPSRLLTAATSVARRVVPTGRLRAWGGEKLRRVQISRERRPSTGGRNLDEPAATDWLRQYYDAPNRELAKQFPVSIADWE